jgi:predicted RNase H-like HicB family nuclease
VKEILMKFIIAIEPGNDLTAWGVVVPDLPGCFSAGDTLDEAMDNAKEAIELHVQTMLEDGQSLPTPRTLTQWQADPEFSGWVWAVVDAPVEKYFGPAEKINITVPRIVLAHIDEYAKRHGLSRSGFLVQAARTAMHA